MHRASLLVQWLGIRQQCRRRRFSPRSGKIPWIKEQLSLCTQLPSQPPRDRKPQHLSPCSASTEPHEPRAEAPKQERPPRREAQALQLESPHAATETQGSHRQMMSARQVRVRKQSHSPSQQRSAIPTDRSA